MSLHWILVVTLTLLHCFTAYPIHVKNIKINIEHLKKIGCNQPDSTFYSPSGNNGCTIEALQCSVLELETVKAECTETQLMMTQRVNRIRDSINVMLKNETTGQADFKNCFCKKEKPAQKTYEEFLDNLWKLVQMLNSKLQ